MDKKRILVVGLEPDLVDYSSMRDMNADKVRAGLTAGMAQLAGLGHDADLCMTDLGDTAEAVVAGRLSERPYDCVVIGAGIRTIPAYFLLFEKLVNVVHRHAPAARIAFNTRPSDTAEAVQRWL
jgi:hypothetical protein